VHLGARGLPPDFHSSHPEIEISPNPLKTIIEEIINRHTYANFHSIRILPLGNQKSKGEEKAPARRSPKAKAASRYTWKLKNRETHENKRQTNF
jgi:hypothetical protein